MLAYQRVYPSVTFVLSPLTYICDKPRPVRRCAEYCPCLQPRRLRQFEHQVAPETTTSILTMGSSSRMGVILNSDGQVFSLWWQVSLSFQEESWLIGQFKFTMFTECSLYQEWAWSLYQNLRSRDLKRRDNEWNLTCTMHLWHESETIGINPLKLTSHSLLNIGFGWILTICSDFLKPAKVTQICRWKLSRTCRRASV
jgi:hypothetical protein